jgi:hypothetical protein
VRRKTPYLILVSGWALILVYAYPGLMSFDSITQLQEARAHFYTDGHPPAMAAFWRVIDHIVSGPFLMLVIQTSTFLGGLYLVLRRSMSDVAAATAAVLIFIFPPVLAPMAAIWKDCFMAGFLMLGAAGLMSKRRSLRIASLVLMFGASAFRYNALAATLPLVVVLFVWSESERTGWKQIVTRYTTAAAVWLGVTIAAFGFGKAITDQPMYIWQSSLALHDIAGTLSEVDGTLGDDELRKLLAGTEIRVDHDIHAAIRRQYTPIDFEPLIWREGHLWDVPLAGTKPAPQSQRDAISRAFWQTVTGHPVAYLRHRVAAMWAFLAVGDRPIYGAVTTIHSQNRGMLASVGLHLHSNPVQRHMQQAVVKIALGTPLFRPWLYVVLSLILLPLARKHRDVLAILLSGLGLEASLFFLAPTPDFRYSHWMVVCCCTAVVMLVARRMRRSPS